MKRYFKCRAALVAPPGQGEGVAYLEFDNEWATRRVDIYENRQVSSLSDYQEMGPALCDQPLSRAPIDAQDAISRADFESVWRQAEAQYLRAKPRLLWPLLLLYLHLHRRMPMLLLRLRLRIWRIRIALGWTG
jgi:hypothetical protein